MPWAAAATLVSGVGSFFSNKKSKTKEPKYLTRAKESALNRAETIADREYTPYQNQRVAGMTANEQRAGQIARDTGEQAGQYFDLAGKEIGSALQDYNTENLGQYMNPYLEQVLNPQIRRQNQQYDRSRSALLNSKAGSFGGDRSAFEASELERVHRDALEEVTGRTYAEAYDSAQKAFFADSDRRMRAADSYRAVGGDIAQLNRQQVQDLMATGGLERVLQQADLDFDYQQFIENRDWDVNNLQPLLQAISVSSGGNSTTTVTDNSDAISTTLGAAATLAGMYFGRDSGKKTPTEATTVKPSVQTQERLNA